MPAPYDFTPNVMPIVAVTAPAGIVQNLHNGRRAVVSGTGVLTFSSTNTIDGFSCELINANTGTTLTVAADGGAVVVGQSVLPYGAMLRFSRYTNAAGQVCFQSSQSVSVGGVYNYTKPSMLHWRAAVARVRAGTGRGRLLIISDSTGMGAGTGYGGTTNLNGAFPNAWPQALSRIPNIAVPMSSKAFFGSQATQVAYGVYDTRVVLGTGWAGGTGVPALGANLWKFTTGGGVGTFSFTPSGVFDNFTVFYIKQASQGTIGVNVDGGSSLGTLTCTAGGQSYVAQTFSCARAAHTINLVANNDGSCYVGSIIAWDSAVPAIDLLQGCWYGAKTANFAVGTAPWNPLPSLSLFQPDLIIIALTINDSNGATLLSDYRTQLQAIITAAQAQGDVMLMTGAPSSTAAATNGTLTQYINIMVNLAQTNGLPFLSIVDRWQSYAAANPVLPYYDTVHPGALGAQDIGQAVNEVLMAL